MFSAVLLNLFLSLKYTYKVFGTMYMYTRRFHLSIHLRVSYVARHVNIPNNFKSEQQMDVAVSHSIRRHLLRRLRSFPHRRLHRRRCHCPWSLRLSQMICSRRRVTNCI